MTDNSTQSLPQNPYPPLICGVMTANTAQSTPIHLCQSHTVKGQMTQSHLSVNKSQTQSISTCQTITTIGFKSLTACQIIKAKDGQLIANHHTAKTKAFKLLSDCTAPKLSATVHYGNGVGIDFSKTLLYHTCQTSSIAPIVHYHNSLEQNTANTQLSAHCHRFSTKQAIIVPCRYYPIAPPPKPKPKQSPCPDKPPSNRLPLPLTRKTKVVKDGIVKDRVFKPYALPLPLACFNYPSVIGTNPNTKNPSHPHYNGQSPSHPSHLSPSQINVTIPNITPTQKGYIMHHTISASLDNIPIHPLSFNIKTDMSSFCFSGQIEIGLSDFNAIKDKLHRPSVSASETAVIRVVVGNTAFVFIGEEITHNQAFAQNTISLSGRSITAQLSKDYATAAPLDNVDLYASQIVAKQLEYLSLSAHFGIDDYLIPAGTYTTTGKTPIGVLDDIAKAYGGNVSGAWMVVACGRGVWFCNEFKSRQGYYMYCGDTTADSKGGRGVCLAHSGGDKNGIYNSSERQAIIPYDASIDTRIYTPPVFWHVLSDTKSKVVFESLFDGLSDKTNTALISPVHFFAGRELYMINAYMPSKNVLNNYDTVTTADMTFINHATGTYLRYGRQMASNMYVRTDGWEF